jgi:hypothetical protein
MLDYRQRSQITTAMNHINSGFHGTFMWYVLMLKTKVRMAGEQTKQNSNSFEI